MKPKENTIHEIKRSVTKILRAGSCDFADRPHLPRYYALTNWKKMTLLEVVARMTL
jgi:hypothetical protein